MADRIEEIVFTKYGWDNNKRNLDDLLMEIRDRSLRNQNDRKFWSEENVIQIVWDVGTVPFY